MNLHSPQRGTDETFDQYKMRRKLARKIADAVEGPRADLQRGLFKQRTNPLKPRAGVRDMGQRPVLVKPRKHKRKDAHTCLAVGRIAGSKKRRVWRQGEPLLYLKPFTHLKTLLFRGKDFEGKPNMHPDWKFAVRCAKHGRGDTLHRLVQQHASK